MREQERARFSNLDEHDFGLGPSLLQGAVTEKGKAKKKGADKKDAEKIVSHSAALQVRGEGAWWGSALRVASGDRR